MCAIQTFSDWPDTFRPRPTWSVARNVLVVDDSRVQRRILSALLRRWGYEVLEAESGAAALEVCRRTAPDLILSDWMMPGMTGLEFCRAFRALEHQHYVYFILLTSRAEKQDVATGLRTGADDFLTKPVNAAELQARLKAGERILSMQKEVTEKNRQLNETLEELRRARRALDRDLDAARRLQQSLVPERYHRLPGGDVSLLLRPSGHVGGDLVGTFRISETRIGIYGIDVAGHGIASALMTARLAGYLTGSSLEQNIAMTVDATGQLSMRPPDEVCAILNRLLVEDVETQHYFTMLLAECELQTGRLRMAQAGHPSPLIVRANGSTEFAGTGGLPIGLIEDADFTTIEVCLNPGDRLLVYSDGMTELPTANGELIDEDELAKIIGKHNGATGPGFLELLLANLIQHTAGRDLPDDVSAVLVERTPLPAAKR